MSARLAAGDAAALARVLHACGLSVVARRPAEPALLARLLAAPRVEDVIAAAATVWRVDRALLVGRERARSIAWRRMIAMAAARRITGASSVQIGRAFGGRDHSTVLHALARVEGWLAEDSAAVAAALAALEAAVATARGAEERP